MTQQEYFDQTVSKVLTQIGYTMNISITILDHETLPGKHKNALGVCHNYFDNYHITIDQFFVEECYKYFVLNDITGLTWELNGETLEQVICHELAHTQIWRHGKKHTELTNRLLSKVTLPEKYYRYLKKKIS
jgi:hypothetical protein